MKMLQRWSKEQKKGLLQIFKELGNEEGAEGNKSRGPTYLGEK